MFNPRATVVRRVSPDRPEPAVIREAADVLRRGGLVAFPTETVYGLGANAFDVAAVETIFAAKDRPSTNPMIVHVANADAAKTLTSAWPEIADRLAEEFWPGSLTLVLPKHLRVPNVVTAGGRTVGLRVPAHPVALALLKAAELPIAAAECEPCYARLLHFGRSCFPWIEWASRSHPRRRPDARWFRVDGDRSHPGAAKTVAPGLVSVLALKAITGDIDIGPTSQQSLRDEPVRSPGQQQRHYAPRAKLVLSRQSQTEVQKFLGVVNRVGWIRSMQTTEEVFESESLEMIIMPGDAASYASRLYAALHELDDAQVDVIVVDSPPETAEWMAIHDRLRRAAHLE